MYNQTLIGQRYTELTRDALSKDHIDDKPNFFSSTG
jgi:hypothetical protein